MDFKEGGIIEVKIEEEKNKKKFVINEDEFLKALGIDATKYVIDFVHNSRRFYNRNATVTIELEEKTTGDQ